VPEIATLEYQVSFPADFTGPSEFEWESKGYLPNVTVAFSDGRSVRLFFYDVVRAGQQVEVTGALVEPNLILVRNIDRPSILAAIREAFEQGYFAESHR